jgi:hypothetical protein
VTVDTTYSDAYTKTHIAETKLIRVVSHPVTNRIRPDSPPLCAGNTTPNLTLRDPLRQKFRLLIQLVSPT